MKYTKRCKVRLLSPRSLYLRRKSATYRGNDYSGSSRARAPVYGPERKLNLNVARGYFWLGVPGRLLGRGTFE